MVVCFCAGGAAAVAAGATTAAYIGFDVAGDVCKVRAFMRVCYACACPLRCTTVRKQGPL